MIGATAATDGTCQLSASSKSLSTRYDVTSVETHEVGVKFVDVATTEHVSLSSCVGHDNGKLFPTLDSEPTLTSLGIDWLVKMFLTLDCDNCCNQKKKPSLTHWLAHVGHNAQMVGRGVLAVHEHTDEKVIMNET